MKIIFLCGSIEPGKDGVGDYTRRLCGELIRKGNKVELLALCDNHQRNFSINEIQEVEQTSVLVHRIPFSTSNKQRFIWTQGILDEFQPDWISLQFVPYSFNMKGLPFWLPSFLNRLKGNHQWHIMFHELWIGMDLDATFKSKAIGFLQKSIVLKILKHKERIINTQTDLYQFKIETLGHKADILPLFSNIIKKRYSNNIERAPNEFELKFCVFGSIHYGAPVEKFIYELKKVLLESKEKRVLKFFFIGNCGVAIEEWKKTLLSNNINFEVTGFLTDEKISLLLSSCQYGISTTPYLLSQKSGTLTAMIEHGLTVLNVARDWKVKGYNQSNIINLINYENKESIDGFLNIKFEILNDNNLEFVANKFLKGLK